MSASSNGSESYRYYRYYTGHGSVNHPSFDRGTISTLSSNPPSQTHSDPAKVTSRTSSSNSYRKSCFSEPAGILTRQLLELHNADAYSSPPPPKPRKKVDQTIIDQVNERCDIIEQDFEEKIKQLEAQFAQTEQDVNQSKDAIKELQNMEKEYINQGIQTEIQYRHISTMEQEVLQSRQETDTWKNKAHELESFVNKAKEIIWDTPFIPAHAICRQLPTIESDDEDICEYHKQRIEKYRLKSDHEKQLYANDHNATLKRISTWTETIKY